MFSLSFISSFFFHFYFAVFSTFYSTTLSYAHSTHLTPTPSSTLIHGSRIHVSWTPSSLYSPSQTISIILCTHEINSNSYREIFPLINQSSFPTNLSSLDLTIPQTFLTTSSSHNLYFLKLLSSFHPDLPSVVNYSHHFSLSEMSGTFALTIQQQQQHPYTLHTAITSLPNSTPPLYPRGLITNSPSINYFTIPYSLQSGPTRYVPMQPLLPTKITANVKKPLYPISSAFIAKSPLPPPSVTLTITQERSYTISMTPNPDPPNPHNIINRAKPTSR